MTNQSLITAKNAQKRLKSKVSHLGFSKILALLSLSGIVYFAPMASNANENQALGKILISSTPTYTIQVTNTIPTESYIWLNDPLLKSFAKTHKPIPIAADGAMGDNRTTPSKVQVGWQRAAIDLIRIGVSTGNRSIIAQGISGYRWAFDRQSASGAFGVSEYPEVISFLGSYARAILFLQQSGYNSDASILAQYIPKMTKSINSPLILSGEQRFNENIGNNDVTNQLFWSALSYKLMHLVKSNPRLDTQSQAWLDQGLNAQRSDGVFPEKGGSDTSYQGWGLELLSVYCFYSPDSKSLINPYQIKGFQWLTSKILPDGTMDISQNTRTGSGQELDPSGNPKQAKYGRPLSYQYWSYLGGGQAAIDIATRLRQAP